MGLGRDEFPTHNEARMWMGYGNRLFLGQNGRFRQAPFNDTVARTGWSWGCTSLDFDNDADSDLFIVNGQFSGKTTTDYCTRFWCHDIYYNKEARPDGAIREFFQLMMPLFQGEGPSWNGYEHNALLMNLNGRKFVNVAFLMGVSHEVDSRMAVSGDLDSDGRVDIVFEQKDHRNQQSKLYFLRNEFPVKNHWVGVHLRSRNAAVSPLGAKVLVRCGDGKELLQHNLSGHSVWAQHSNTVHFGLGPINHLKAIQVIWPDGSKTELEQPAINTYHVAEPRRAMPLSIF